MTGAAVEGLPCRHCGQAVEQGTGHDGALFHASLGLDDRHPVHRYPVPYVAHLACQVEVLEQLAEASHEAITRWRSPGGAVDGCAAPTRLHLPL